MEGTRYTIKPYLENSVVEMKDHGIVFIELTYIYHLSTIIGKLVIVKVQNTIDMMVKENELD